MNGVREDIRHVLDTQQVKSETLLSPHDMYGAVKKYETYIACNRRLEGQTWATSHPVFKSPGYKPKFHKTTAFVAAVNEPEDDASYEADLIPSGNEGSLETTSNPYDEAGYLSLTLWKRWWVETNSPDHLIKDCPEKNKFGPPQPKGPQQNKLAQD